MAEIKCPQCGTIISLEQSDLDSVVQQVRDEQFTRELEERAKLYEEQAAQALELAKTQAQTELSEAQHRNDAQIEQLRAQLAAQEQAFKAEKQLAVTQAVAESERKVEQLNAAVKQKESQLLIQQEQLKMQQDLAVAQAVAESERKVEQLNAAVKEKDSQIKSQQEQSAIQQELAVAQAVAQANKERDDLAAALQLKDSQHEAAEARLREQLTEQQKRNEEVIAFQKEEIERMKDMKSKLSTKMIGETLEQHCQYEFDRIRAVAFPRAYFEKDNDASQGTKGDFIFREEDEDGNEVISIMFEMKNESDSNSVKKKNEDHFAKLDKDRTKKSCEYAVLVSLLEPESELYNEGIVDVSHRFPKMYVIRPQFFIPIISLLRNAALSSLQYKRELALVRQQELDITNFERDLDVFKQGFFKNFGDASQRFEDAIKAIDKAIADLQKAREKLVVSEKHLTAANNKLEGLTVKKLTRKNPTMKAKFEALHAGDEEEQDEEA